MVNHDGNNGNTTSNVDLDMFVIDSEENNINVGGTYSKVETAYVPAGEGDIYYVIIDHYRVDNSVPSAYVLTQTPTICQFTRTKRCEKEQMQILI